MKSSPIFICIYSGFDTVYHIVIIFLHMSFGAVVSLFFIIINIQCQGSWCFRLCRTQRDDKEPVGCRVSTRCTRCMLPLFGRIHPLFLLYTYPLDFGFNPFTTIVETALQTRVIHNKHKCSTSHVTPKNGLLRINFTSIEFLISIFVCTAEFVEGVQRALWTIDISSLFIIHAVHLYL
jgi:hypothetical protein